MPAKHVANIRISLTVGFVARIARSEELYSLSAVSAPIASANFSDGARLRPDVQPQASRAARLHPIAHGRDAVFIVAFELNGL